MWRWTSTTSQRAVRVPAAVVAADPAFATVVAEHTVLVTEVPPHRPGGFGYARPAHRG